MKKVYILPIFVMAIGITYYKSSLEKHNETSDEVNLRAKKGILNVEKANPSKKDKPAEKVTSQQVELKQKMTLDKNKHQELEEEVLALYTAKSITPELLKEINTKIEVLKEWKKENQKDLSFIELQKPEFILTLKVAKSLSIEQIMEKTNQKTLLNINEIYAIKTFSESKDFHIILEQGRFNYKTINMERLKTIYSNTPPIVKGEDFTHGVTSLEPVELTYSPNDEQ